MRTKVFALLMATTALTAFVNPGHSQIWDAGAQWSTTSNPNGAWSYGRRWSQNGDGFDLCSYMYGGTFWLLCGSCWAPSIQAGPDLWANDNANGYPVVRWTCPRTGTYTIASSFVGADGRGNNNLVWIVIGGSPIFSGHIQAYPGAAGYTNTLNLQNGAYIDFVVAWNGGTPADYNWTVVNATITSVSNVVIQTQPQSQTNVVGSTVPFQVLASGSPPLHYQWQLNGTNLTDNARVTGSQSTNLTISSVMVSDAGNYQAIVTNACGSVTSAPAVLTVRYPRSAREWYALGYATNGVYVIDPDGTGPMSVSCLMTLSGGGWTKLTAIIANTTLNAPSSLNREYLYMKNNTTLWYRSPVTKLVWNWSSGKDLYGTYYYSSGSGEASFNVTASGEHQSYGVGGSSGSGGTYKCLVIYPSCLDPANAQVQLCQDRPGIFGGACQCSVTVYIREQSATKSGAIPH